MRKESESLFVQRQAEYDPPEGWMLHTSGYSLVIKSCKGNQNKAYQHTANMMMEG